jgi:ABC-2 type transport system permease protein
MPAAASNQEVPIVTSLARAVRPAGWAEQPALLAFVIDTAAIADIELRKVRHDPIELLMRAAQPVLWLLVFGQVISATRAIPTGGLPYLDYLAPGVLAQSALFAAIFYGITIVWERDLGVVHRYLVSPASRSALVAGKALAAGLRSLVQAFIVYLLAILLGVNPSLNPVRLLGVALTVVLGSAVFAMFSLIVACIVRSRERLMGIGQLITMPLFFASSAIYPVSLMPDWLKAVSAVNPLTYMVEALRSLMVAPSVNTAQVVVDLGVLTFVLVALLAVAKRLYPRVAM